MEPKIQTNPIKRPASLGSNIARPLFPGLVGVDFAEEGGSSGGAGGGGLWGAVTLDNVFEATVALSPTFSFGDNRHLTSDGTALHFVDNDAPYGIGQLEADGSSTQILDITNDADVLAWDPDQECWWTYRQGDANAYRIDPTDGSILQTLGVTGTLNTVTKRYARGLAYYDGSLWYVNSTESGFATGLCDLYRLDPTDLSLVTHYPGAFPHNASNRSYGLWVNGGILAMPFARDPATGVDAPGYMTFDPSDSSNTEVTFGGAGPADWENDVSATLHNGKVYAMESTKLHSYT